MLQVALRRGGFVAALAIGLLFVLPATGFTHSGGLDGNGCHAGSQPYHCHGGGSGSGGGGGGGGGGGTVSSGPTAAERAEIANAQTELAQAEANHAQSKPRAAKLHDRLESDEKKLEKQQSTLEDLQDEVDRDREEAASLRAAWITEREDAEERIEQVNAENRAAQAAYEGRVAGAVFVAAFLGGFLLLRVAKWVAGLILGTWLRIATMLVGLLGLFLLLGLSTSVGSFALEVVVVALGGLLLSFVLMLARTWLKVATMPPKLAIVLLGVAAAVAVLAIAGVATTAPPVAGEPAPADQAMVEEAQSDPAAEEFDQAQEADAAADELQADIDDLTTELNDFESTVEALAERTEKAKTNAQADKEAVTSAKNKLDSLS